MPSVSELADILAGELVGDGSGIISGVAGLREAGPNDLSFLSKPKYQALLQDTRAGAVLVSRTWDGTAQVPLIRVDDPDAAFERAVQEFCPPPPRHVPGIDPSARIGEDVVLGKDVCIGPNVVIEAGTRLGDRCVVLAGVLIGQQVRIGDDVMIHAGAVLREHVHIGDRVIIHNNSVIGSEGFGYVVDEHGVRTKVPQLGSVSVGDDTEIGANVCIDRARFGYTRIGRGVKIDNLVQIGHNVVIEDHVVLVSQVGISGSTIVGKHAILGGQVGVAGHLTIGERVVVGAQGGVTKDIPAGAYVWGTPAAPFERYSKSLAQINRLPKLVQKLASLEERLASLEAELARR